MSARVNAYLAWAETAEKRFRELFAGTDLVDGLFGDRYWHIASLPIGAPYGTRIMNQEVEHQRARLDDAIESLKEWQKLGERPGDLLALDTNSFLQYQPYDQIPWAGLRSGPVRLILTMPTLDEIEAKKRGDNVRLKKRARKIMPRIDKAFGDDGLLVVQVERDGKPMPGVTLEVLRDPSGYRSRSTDMDEEFLDRCVFLHQATSRPVVVVTADTGMKIRVRGRGEGLELYTIPEAHRIQEPDVVPAPAEPQGDFT